MILQNVEIKNKSQLNRIKELYFEAFPANERAPFSILIKGVKKRKAEMFDLIHNQQWCGIAYVVTYKDMAYLFYFAIDGKLRGKGLGTLAMNAILEYYREYRFFVALENWKEESENREQRIKRHRFYLNSGLKDIDHKIKEADVIYCTMCSKGTIEPEEYNELMKNYMGFFMRHFIDVRMID